MPAPTEGAGSTRFRVVGRAAVTGEPVEYWICDGIVIDGPVRDAVELTGWVLPGLVDAHCHIGYSAQGAVTRAQAEEQARTNLAAGVLLIRDCGSPIDTRPLVDRDDLPVLIRAGRHIARPRRYIRELGVEVEPDRLVDEVRVQLALGGGWIKLVGDWIDRAVGDLAPLWPDDILAEAVSVAHAGGARVTAHVFGEDALPGLLGAGVDCLEHGTGLTVDTIGAMVAGGVHLVPTLINIANFPEFAAAADRYPRYAAHMRDLFARHRETFAAAVEAGVVLHAGTDAGGNVEHGLIVDEIVALAGLGLPAADAIRAASQATREFLGVPDPVPGAPADLLVFAADPRSDLSELRRPTAILRAGRVRGGSAMMAAEYRPGPD